MTGISIRVDGLDRANQALASAARRIEDPLPLYIAIGDALVVSTLERFDTETDPQGSPWPMSLRVMMEGGKTLTDTGVLRGSITREADAGGVSVGTNDIRARIHQEGGVIRAKTAKGLRFAPMGANQDIIRRSVTMPRRAFLGLDDEDLAEIERLAGNYIMDPLTGQPGSDFGGLA